MSTTTQGAQAAVAPGTGASEVDLVVVGAGLAGLVAAVRAAELGCRVALLEKGAGDEYPCNSRYSGGIFHVSYNDPKNDPQRLLDAMTEATAGYARDDLLKVFSQQAGASMDWLRTHGARFIRGAIDWHAWVLAPPRPPTTGLDWKGRGADALLRALTRLAIEHKVLRLTGVRVQSLHLHEGRVVGVRAQQEGQILDYHARAVVLADGGFQGDAELFRQHIGPCPERVVQRGAGTGTGDGLRMALAAGAAATRMDRFYGHVLSRDALTNDRLWPYPQIDALAAAGLVLNPDGRRVMDEGLGGVYVANHLATLDDPASCTVIADARIWDGPGKQAQIPPNPLLERVGGTLYRADSIAELARLAGIDRAALETTVADYNAALQSDSLAGLVPPRSTLKAKAWPIVQAPFYAIPICTGITHTMGGISVNGDAQALRPDGSPIAGLYAAGTTTGGLEGGDVAGYVGGLIKATVLGLRAAEHSSAQPRG